ncbi:gamma-glutamyl-gamma-aminobutyrate hydrolase [Enterococcus saigonensis]|uniref:Gamma-glutamyl-gamma-aminobutyrate hydrolase n=1 Tax=Enterococcus saigonensis TaxID=1805431 RepID=A0A679IJC7_9ENTE|nr:gamma-glutamyl-gamma-aminobutyrate hydrolase family protein [Enterococcus saigonensis]BCA86222.1 gamma-glutamyl-gamma-aminobutyrate hydrolase [Enterococcus saigonensis]
MKPVIGIAANEQTMIDTDSHWISYTPKNFITGIQNAGGLPVLLPIGAMEDAKSYIKKIDKLLLAGGQDVSPECYNALPQQKLGATNHRRDLFEIALVKEAVKVGKPIIGVCRGMQLLNVVFGGTLLQDLSFSKEPLLKHVQVPTPFELPTHPVEIDLNSHLGEFLPQSYQVNSFHHQAIDQLAPEFVVTATAPDGVVEGIESINHPIIGVQWHPELAYFTMEKEREFFAYIVQKFN